MMLEPDSDGIPKFDQPERYRQYAKNVDAKDPDRARRARIVAVKLQAQLDGVKSVVEQRVPRGHLRLRVDGVQEARARLERREQRS
jgi:hypothetical protein